MSDKKKFFGLEVEAKDMEAARSTAGVAAATIGVGAGLVAGREMDYRREVKRLNADIKHYNNMRNRLNRTSNTVSMVRKMGDRIESMQQKAIDRATKENVATVAPKFHADKPEPSANQNQRNAGNVRSTKPAPKHPYQMSYAEMRDRKLHNLISAQKTANVLRTGVYEPTQKAIKEGNEAIRARKPVPVPNAANQNKVRTMGRGGGGGIYDPSGMIGKAVEKFFKKV